MKKFLALALALMLTLPTLAGQFGMLAGALPSLVETLQGRLNQLTAWLTEKGIETEPIREDTCNGGRFTFFKDPDGLPLEFHE